jgi:uncharacterized protein
MKLSDGEKLIFLMLADIYKNLKIKNGEFDPNFVSNTIFHDHLRGFNWRYHSIPFEDSEQPPEVSETADILDMWWLVERAYEKLSPAGKTKIKDATGRSEAEFIGFDGNNENHFGIARYLVEDPGRFEYFKGRNLNSHSRVIEGYRRMCRVFEPIRKHLANRSLNADELIEILNATRHPQ